MQRDRPRSAALAGKIQEVSERERETGRKGKRRETGSFNAHGKQTRLHPHTKMGEPL